MCSITPFATPPADRSCDPSTSPPLAPDDTAPDESTPQALEVPRTSSLLDLYGRGLAATSDFLGEWGTHVAFGSAGMWAGAEVAGAACLAIPPLIPSSPVCALAGGLSGQALGTAAADKTLDGRVSPVNIALSIVAGALVGKALTGLRTEASTYGSRLMRDGMKTWTRMTGAVLERTVTTSTPAVHVALDRASGSLIVIQPPGGKQTFELGLRPFYVGASNLLNATTQRAKHEVIASPTDATSGGEAPPHEPADPRRLNVP